MKRLERTWLALALLGGCVERIDLGVPEPPGGDGGTEDMGADDLGAPDLTRPGECSELARPDCDERKDCDWYGGDRGFCADAGPCDEHHGHRSCVTDRECDWEGEAKGFCIPTEGDPGDCSDLYELHCHETLGCRWEGGDFGECYGEPLPGCTGLSLAQCDLHDRCRWYGDARGFCGDAAPCGEHDWEGCVSRSSCDWHGEAGGHCAPAERAPGGCEELLPEPDCTEAGCTWDGAEFGECFGMPDPAPDCAGLVADSCFMKPLCDWYGPEPGGFCDRAGVCDELSDHGACVARAACDWQGEAGGFCRPAESEPTACSDAGFVECRHRDPDCKWVGGDFGECVDAR